MASGENPFSAMVDVIREEVRRGAGPSWNMGEVISVSPLKVRYRGVQLNADQVAAAGQWAAQLKVGDSVPVLPDRDDGRFAIIQPADSAAFASAEHDHDALYAGLAHAHEGIYSPDDHAHGDITNDGKVGSTADLLLGTGTGGAIETKTLAQLKSLLLDIQHPVGSVYISTDSANPGTLFGGTWSAFGAGRVLVGLNPSDPAFDTAGETGGDKSNTVSVSGVAKIAASSTNMWMKRKSLAWTADLKWTVASAAVSNTDNLSSGAEIDATATVPTLQPYVVVYMWVREE